MVRRAARACERALLRRLPEHALFATDSDRERALEQLDAELHTGRGLGRTETLIIIASLMLLGAVAWGVLAVVPGARGAPLRAIVGAAALGAAAAAVWAWRRGVACRLRAKLIEFGVPVCRACGYPMRGLARPRCPECGWEADEAVAGLLERGEGS